MGRSGSYRRRRLELFDIVARGGHVVGITNVTPPSLPFAGEEPLIPRVYEMQEHINNMLPQFNKPLFLIAYITLVVFLYKSVYIKTTSVFNYIKDIIVCMIVGVVISSLGVLLNLYIIPSRKLLFLIPIILFLSCINKRYACLAYSGAVLCVLSVCFKGMEIDIKGVIGAVGVFHLVEAIMISLKTDLKHCSKEICCKDGKLVTVNIIEKYWFVPFSLNYFGTIILPTQFALEFRNRRMIKICSLELLIYALTLLFIYEAALTLDYMKYVGLLVMPVMHEMFVVKNRLWC